MARSMLAFIARGSLHHQMKTQHGLPQGRQYKIQRVEVINAESMWLPARVCQVTDSSSKYEATATLKTL